MSLRRFLNVVYEHLTAGLPDDAIRGLDEVLASPMPIPLELQVLQRLKIPDYRDGQPPEPERSEAAERAEKERKAAENRLALAALQRDFGMA